MDLSFPLAAVQQDEVVRADGGGTANAQTATTTTPYVAFSTSKVIQFRPSALNTSKVVTLNVTSSAGGFTTGALQIQMQNGDLPNINFFKPLRTYFLRYNTAFGGVWDVLVPHADHATDLSILKAAASGGSANAQTANTTITGEYGSYAANNTQIDFIPNFANTVVGSVMTININSIGALHVKFPDGSEVPVGFFQPSQHYHLAYNAGGWFEIARPFRRQVTTQTITEYDPTFGPMMADQALETFKYFFQNGFPTTGWVAPTFTNSRLPGSVAYDNTFASAGDETGFKALVGATLGTSSEVQLPRVAGSPNYIECNPLALDAVNGLANDINHVFPGRGQVFLHNILRNGSPLPNISDVRNIRVTLEARAVNYTIPNSMRLGLHYQGTDPVTGRVINYLNTYQMLDELLGFLGHRLSYPNELTTVADSGWVSWAVDFIPYDFAWFCLGSSDTRTDTYGVSPINRVMANGYADMIVLGQISQQFPDPRQPPAVRPTGSLRFRRVRIETP